MRTTLSLVALITAGAALSACGAIPSAGAASGTPAQPQAHYLGAITGTERLAGAGVVLESPGQARAAVSVDTAYATCLTGDSICPPGRSPDVNLALATSPQAGKAAAGGAITPLMHKTLVYVMTWAGVPCTPAGGPPTAPGSTPRIYTCTISNFVDAHTGKVLYSAQSSN